MTIRFRSLAVAVATAVVLATPLRAQTGFVVEYPPVQSTAAARSREWLMETRRLDMLASGLNSWIRMPRRVALRMVECPSSDIRWNAAEHAVEMCYRMITRIYGMAAGQDSLRTAAPGAHLFVNFHGVAHAIIGELALPVGGDAEAAVDELMALLLVAGRDREFPLFVVGGIDALHAADPQWGSWDYATEHGLGPERFRNVACLVYGADPDGFTSLRTAGLVPAGARKRCRAAALRSANLWSRRLGRYLR
jgi:Putative metallopeptidase